MQAQQFGAVIVGVELQQRTEKGSVLLGGRAILRTVMRHYKPHDQSVEYYRITDVSGLKVVDGNLEAFQIQWNKWLAGLATMPSDDFLEPWYYDVIKSHKGIAVDIATYERLPERSGGDRSYAFLVRAVDGYVERQRKKI